jgi:hypothetical protein
MANDPKIPSEKELYELYESADELRNQSQREIDAGESNRRELEAILPNVNNPAPIIDALNQTDDQIANSIQDRNAIDRRASDISDAILWNGEYDE